MFHILKCTDWWRIWSDFSSTVARRGGFSFRIIIHRSKRRGVTELGHGRAMVVVVRRCWWRMNMRNWMYGPSDDLSPAASKLMMALSYRVGSWVNRLMFEREAKGDVCRNHCVCLIDRARCGSRRHRRRRRLLPEESIVVASYASATSPTDTYRALFSP